MKISIDRELCAGHAQCAATAPDVYDLDELGYALPHDGAVPPLLADRARVGAQACPERAIRIVEQERQ